MNRSNQLEDALFANLGGDASLLRLERLARVARRDREADGLFWCSVVTTRIYCRPTCPSRCARPEHIRFHDTLAEARATGFRACKRCRPEDLAPLGDRQRLLVEHACRAIRTSSSRPSSKQLAASLGISAAHLYRIFKAATGETPGSYAQRTRVHAPRR